MVTRYVVNADGCWLWQGYINAFGYGVNRRGLAHRVYYQSARGPIPRGMELDHLCRVRSCVNPDHLEAVTHLENHRRSAVGKLTESQVIAIRRSPASIAELAASYGVAEVTVYQAQAGTSWAAVPFPADAVRSRNPRRRPALCVRGHEFTPENTRVEAGGKRKCRTCCAIRAREYRARRSA